MTRYPFLFLFALAVFIGSLTATFATLSARDYDLRGYRDAIRSAPDLPFRVPRLGVNAELTQYTPEQLRDHLDLMRRAGVVWVRQFAYWDQIEPERGRYEWATWDALADALRDYPELSLVAVLMNTPEWARDTRAGRDQPTAPPADPADFAEFARQFALRYAGSIGVYQVWDEPNLFTAWGGLPPSPVQYLALLEAGAGAIRSAQPRAVILPAGLAPTTEDNRDNISDLRFLDDLYRLGLTGAVSAVAAKPYGFDFSPDDRTVRDDTLNFSRVVALREIMERHGDHTAPLWATNWGWNALPDDWSGAPSIWGSVSEDQRAAYTLRGLERVEREMPWVGGMILYHWQPAAPPDDPLWGFALVSPDGTPTATLSALLDRQPVSAATDGLYPPQNPFASYRGVWTFSDLGADIGWQRDSRLELRFYGRQVALLLRRDDYVGYLYPQINGSADAVDALPRDNAGNPYIILTSPSLSPELSVVAVARALPLGEHTLSAVADRGFDRWALAGYAVSSGDLAEPYNRQAIISGITSALAAVAVIVTGAGVNWQPLARRAGVVLRRLALPVQVGGALVSSLLLMVGVLLTWGDAVPQVFRREPVHLVAAIATSGLLYLNPAFVVSVICSAVLLVLIYNRLVIGLVLVIGYAPFFLFPVELYRFAFPMAELLMILTFGACALRVAVGWAHARRDRASLSLPTLNAMDYGMVAWLALGTLSLLWAQQTGVAVTEWRTMIVEPVMFYAVWRVAAPSLAEIRWVIGALLVAGVLVAGIGLALYLMDVAIITAEADARRMASVYGSPNNVALFLGRAIPFALAGALIARGAVRLALAAALALFLVGVALTQSVGGLFLGVPAGVAAVLLVIYGRRAIAPLVVVALALVVMFAGLTSVSERFARALDFTQGTNFYRLRVWESALDMIADRPLTGFGPDQFLYAYRGQYIRPDAWQEPNLSHPHQLILDAWVRLGIGGVILLGYWLWVFVRQVRGALSAVGNQRPTLRWVVAGTVGLLANTVAHGMVDNSIYVADLALIFAFMMALAHSIGRLKTRA